MVMGEHAHAAGEWMLSLRQMRMEMEGMRSGSDGVSSEQVFAASYTVTPTRMTMDMTMFGIMHAPSDAVTLMLMAPYIESEMDHLIFGMAAPLINLNGGSREFTTRSSGIGDVKMTALIPGWESGGRKTLFGIGLSLPTGSIGERDIVPGPGGRIERQLPAPMQLGSGTVDLMPSFTFTDEREGWSWGAQAKAVARLDENHHGYRLGNEVALTSWFSWTLARQASVSLRGNYKMVGDMHGRQSDLMFNPPFAPSRRTVTTAFSENYGGEQLDVAVGLNLIGQEGGLYGHRLALEVAVPVLRDLNGYQLETDWVTTLGWQKAW